MKILITGTAGLLGFILAKKLLTKNNSNPQRIIRENVSASPGISLSNNTDGVESWPIFYNN